MNPANIGAGIFDTGEAGPLVCAKNAVEEVFRNSLIWKTIGSYLNVGDLKVCRLVNSRFHGMVMKETNFLERCLVSLKPYQITRNIFGSTREPWKNVLLKFGDSGECPSWDYCFDEYGLAWLYPRIANVESLSLRIQRGTDGGDFGPVLWRLLIAPKKLRALAIEPICISDGTMDDFDECEDTLENLEELEILQPPSGWQNDMEASEKEQHWAASLSFAEKLRKLRVLKSYYPMPPVIVDGEEYSDLAPAEFCQFKDECILLSVLLARISMANRSSLKHVTLAETGYWSEEGRQRLKDSIGSVTFPSLESATFHLFMFQPHTVAEYLLNLPRLKELEFSVPANLPTTVLNAIGEKSDCLRKLVIKSRDFKGTNWQFLKNTKTEEFQLELQESCFDEDEDKPLPDEALNCVPSTARRLFLRGWFQSSPIPALTRLNPSLVTQLTFINSGDYFADDTMKYICENFKMLRKLNVTKAKQVTDAGFVGSSSGSGSLSGIKGLRILILRECGSITDLALKEIRFLELRYLDLSYNMKLTENGYKGLLSNNPSLETLLTSCKNIYRKKDHLCANHPRLSCVAYRRLKPKPITVKTYE